MFRIEIMKIYMLYQLGLGLFATVRCRVYTGLVPAYKRIKLKIEYSVSTVNGHFYLTCYVKREYDHQ